MIDSLLKRLRLAAEGASSRAARIDEIVTQALAADGFIHPDIERVHKDAISEAKEAWDAYMREARHPRHWISVNLGPL